MGAYTLPNHHLEDALRTELIAARKRAGLTQEQLAERMGYPYAAGPGKVECKAAPLNLRYFLHACDAMGVPASEIIERAARGGQRGG